MTTRATIKASTLRQIATEESHRDTLTRSEVNVHPAVAPALAKWRKALADRAACDTAGSRAMAGGAVTRAKAGYMKAVRGLRVVIIEVPGVASINA